MKRSVWMWLGVLLLPFLLGRFVAQAELESIESDPTWSGSAPGTAVTNSNNTPQGARGPDIAAAPNGNELLIVYERQFDDANVNSSREHDIYFRRSSNGGNSWEPPAAIFTSGNDDSVQPAVAYAGNRAYVVWIEKPNSGTDVLRIRSRTTGASSNWANVGGGTISTEDSTLIDPDITGNGNNLHVVWAEQPSGSLKYGRWNGSSWTFSNIIKDSFTSILSPSIAIDDSGRIHVVWEEEVADGAALRLVVRYSHGQANGSSTTWSSPITLSGTNEDFVTPVINANPNGSIEVGYARQATRSTPQSPRLQDIYFRACSGNCQSASNWSPAGPITALHSVNDTLPFFLLPTIASDTCGNTYVYYHGGPPGVTDGIETIYGVNHKSGWNNTLADNSVSAINSRAVNPTIITTLSKIHIVYQQVTSDSKSQIYYRQGGTVCSVFLPFVAP